MKIRERVFPNIGVIGVGLLALVLQPGSRIIPVLIVSRCGRGRINILGKNILEKILLTGTEEVC
jgi:hypothetical protein